jgi:hypothetical protein
MILDTNAVSALLAGGDEQLTDVLDALTPINLPGDYNGNGTVDAGDYTVWRDTLGSTTNLTADGNGNNTIDTADYDVWKQNFGNTAGSGASKSAVPEPSVARLATLAIAGSLLLLRAQTSHYDQTRRCTA